MKLVYCHSSKWGLPVCINTLAAPYQKRSAKLKKEKVIIYTDVFRACETSKIKLLKKQLTASTR